MSHWNKLLMPSSLRKLSIIFSKLIAQSYSIFLQNVLEGTLNKEYEGARLLQFGKRHIGDMVNFNPKKLSTTIIS